MSEIFEGYERQYCELSTNLSRKCTSIGLVSGEERKQRRAELQNGLDEAESLIRRMDLEARSLPPSQKSVLLAKLREYKLDLTSLKREAKKSSSANDALALRDDLMEEGITHSPSADQRGRLLLSTERLNQSGDKIKESKRTLIETEELGVSILQDLHQQRQALLHSRDTDEVFVPPYPCRAPFAWCHGWSTFLAPGAISVINIEDLHKLSSLSLADFQQLFAGALLSELERFMNRADEFFQLELLVHGEIMDIKQLEKKTLTILKEINRSKECWKHIADNIFTHITSLIWSMLVEDFKMQLHGVGDNIGKSRRILNSVAQRMNRNKLIVGAIISVLIIAIVMLVFVKFK